MNNIRDKLEQVLGVIDFILLGTDNLKGKYCYPVNILLEIYLLILPSQVVARNSWQHID